MSKKTSTMKPARVWRLRILTAVSVPILLLLGVEALLRLFSVGYDPHFFVPASSRATRTGNPRFGERFFPPALVQPPIRFAFPAAKPPGTFRIFVLGGSAAAGVPGVSYNFGRILQTMLEDTFPDRRFEVINTAMVAINSHVAREIARECAQYDPDLFVVYMGNNEVVGPYGAGTVFTSFPKSPALIRAAIRLRATRTGQLLSRLVDRMSSDPDRFTRWRGMEMFLGQQVGADDPRLRQVRASFRRNLESICGVARRNGADVVLLSVATNLRDSPPFASLHAANLPAAPTADWEALHQRAVSATDAGQWQEAADACRAALRIDPAYAEIHYRLAQCLDELGQNKEAVAEFVLARDADSLRFRADTAVNQIIRDVAGQRGVHFADAERAFAESALSPHGAPGRALFYEHVHFTFEGNYLLAAAAYPAVARTIAGRAGSRPARVSNPLPLAACAERLAFTGWNRYRIVSDILAMTSRPPFTNQIGHDARQAALAQALKSLSPFLTKEQLLAARATYERALARSPGDLLLRIEHVRLLSVLGDFKAAEEQWLGLVADLPQDSELRYNLGTVLLRLGRIDEARRSLLEALRLRPDYSLAHGNLAIALAAEGRTEEAMKQCLEAIRCDPANEAAHCNLAKMFLSAGRNAEAAAQAREALRLQPDWQEAARVLEQAEQGNSSPPRP